MPHIQLCSLQVSLRGWHRLAEQDMQGRRQRLVGFPGGAIAVVLGTRSLVPPPPPGNPTSLCRRRCMPSSASLCQSRRLTRNDSSCKLGLTTKFVANFKLCELAKSQKKALQSSYKLGNRTESQSLKVWHLSNFVVCKLLHNTSM